MKGLFCICLTAADLWENDKWFPNSNLDKKGISWELVGLDINSKQSELRTVLDHTQNQISLQHRIMITTRDFYININFS